MIPEIRPGLLILHSNRTELLGEAVFEWIKRNPLGPLEEEVFLVQSNGIAEWLKMSLATQTGVCAATRVELPGRFMWRTYRQVLGRAAVPAESALDKLPLVWRLMAVLPTVTAQPGFEPLAGFLDGGDMARRLQLAQRLADLYDQYQVYRSDWLAAWGAGHDVLPRLADQKPDAAPALPAEQGWQAALWRELLMPLSAKQRAAGRPALHQRFVAQLGAGAAPAQPVARRVVLFGVTHVSGQTLEALAALAACSQVVLAIPNPCRYHWADIIEGRELLRMERRRQPLRRNIDLAVLPLEDMHSHGHPLLAAWGRQGRDFVRQLDAFDDAESTRQHFAGTKIDLFDEADGVSLLGQVQSNIRDLLPLAEHPKQAADGTDRSIVFHVAHGAQREVEILHDQLLALLARTAEDGVAALNPRDIVVMVPDIAGFAPAIRSVFGQYGRGDARFIPFDITDLSERGNNPVLVALEWLLRLPQQRCRLTEVRDLLDVPAIAARFDLTDDELPRLTQWMEGSGIRWGLDEGHRDALGLAACGGQNSWMFGLRRMLLGYAQGDTAGESVQPFHDIEPYAEVGGLDAAMAGSLADLVGALIEWREQSITDATPTEWAARARALLATFMDPIDEQERLTLATIDAALGAWLTACDMASFAEAVPLVVAREAWLGGIDEPGLKRRFRAGGVTFCTLLPMRAVPFEVVCLLGMNDGDYPRSSTRSDFDLMGLPSQRRPGDRSRRDDDRQLMLEAVLSARRVLYVSWAGRSMRDNSEQPPSVLVSQLRDYLASGWAGDVLAQRTTQHPLQPFSRRYFEETAADATLFTHAREWRAAHAVIDATTTPQASLLSEADEAALLGIAALTSFLKNPVREFFHRQLDVRFADDESAMADDEAFAVKGLDEYSLLSEVLKRVDTTAGDSELSVEHQLARILRTGSLPMAEFGRRTAQKLAETLQPMLARWLALHSQFPQGADKLPLRFDAGNVQVEDWLDGLRSSASETTTVWSELLPSKLCSTGKKPEPRPEKLIAAWVRMLLVSACHGEGQVQGILVGKDATVTVTSLPKADADTALRDLLALWQTSMGSDGSHPAALAVACRTALAWLSANEEECEDKAEATYEGTGQFARGEVLEACLARLFPDYETLTADGRFPDLARRLYGPLLQWVKTCVSIELHTAIAASGATTREKTA